MQIASINIGKSGRIGTGRRAAVSGIDKWPQAEGVSIGPAGLPGDTICDGESHGGPDQAVYAYGAADYDWWSAELGRELRPGTFGDNLTIEGLPQDMQAGDRLLTGSLVLEVTAPRIPCSTLAAQMGDPGFGLKFRRAERPGFYFRVVSAGKVVAGDPMIREPTSTASVSMLELFRLWYEPSPSADALQRAIDAPIAARMREELVRRLAATGSRP